MKALSMVLVFAGYLLVYAAVAKQGKFATEPWAGLFADAYQTSGQAPATTPTAPPTSAPVSAPIPAAHTINLKVPTFPFV